jgi:hypothetical protein
MAVPNPHLKVNIVTHSKDIGQFQTVLWYDGPPAPTVDATYIASARASFDAWIPGDMKSIIAADAVYDGYVVTIVDGGGISFTFTSTLGAAVGVVAGDTEADFVATCIRKITGHAGKTGRGRWFLPCVPESWLDDNRLTAPALTAYDLVAADFTTNRTIGGDVWIPTLYSQKDSLFYDIIAYFIDHQAKRQGRRLLSSII